MRGVYNTNFNKLSKNKESKEIVKKLWNFIYEEIKRRIWIKRCDEIAEIEKKEDLAKMTLKKRKNKDNLEGENTSGGKVGIENNGKNKKQKTEEKFKKKIEKNINKNIISSVTLDKLKGEITEGINIGNK